MLLLCQHNWWHWHSSFCYTLRSEWLKLWFPVNTHENAQLWELGREVKCAKLNTKDDICSFPNSPPQPDWDNQGNNFCWDILPVGCIGQTEGTSWQSICDDDQANIDSARKNGQGYNRNPTPYLMEWPTWRRQEGPYISVIFQTM